MLRATALALVSLAVVGSTAAAAPKVGVVVVSHEGLSDEQADEIAYDVAAAVATQIDGEAIAGASVREKLPPALPGDGCEDSPGCGREVAAALGVDEVLLLSAHVAGKTTIVGCHRMPRDPTRPPSERTLRLLGGKAKRALAVQELTSALYATPVAPFTARQAETPEPNEKEETPQVVAKKPAPEPRADENKRPRWLWWAVGGAAAVVVIVAVVLGIALGTTASPTGPAVTLPP